jgi:hypothetical protein
MFKAKGVLAGGLLALALVYSPVMAAQADRQETTAGPEIPAAAPDGVLGYYTSDGGKTLIPIKEEKGVAERIPSGTSKQEFMAAHRMTAEAEAAIVHEVPQVPVIIDGVRYKPEQIHLFDGKQLGFTVGKDGQLYAFTSQAVLEKFMDNNGTAEKLRLDSPDSVFYENINYEWQSYVLWVPPGVSLYSLGPMNNMISSMKINILADNGCTLFDYPNLLGDYFAVNGGTNWPNLGWYGWNDRASSLVVWPQ